jgi:hypothetical protein
VLSKQYDDDYVFVRSRMTAGHAGKLVSQGFDVRVLSGKIPQKTLDSMVPQTATFKPVGISDQANDESTDENAMGDVA